MDYKIELQNNNTDLQNLINKANDLPDAINLDAEITAQDTVISQIQEALANKTSNNGGSSIDTCIVEFTNDLMRVSGATLKYDMTILDNNIINVAETEDLAVMDSTLVSNVVCGSLCVVTGNSLNGRVLHVQDNETYLDIFTINITTNYCCFQIPNSKNLFISVGLA